MCVNVLKIQIFWINIEIKSTNNTLNIYKHGRRKHKYGRTIY